MANRPTIARYHALALLTLIAALSYLCRNAVGVSESSIRRELALTEEQSGWFMSAFLWSYALCQLPSSSFAQRMGSRVSLSIFAVAWSVAAIGIGISPDLTSLVVFQLLMGVAQAGIFPAACNSIARWMPISQRSLTCGILAAGMQAGAIASSFVASRLIAPIGWRWVFVVFALPGILYAVCFYFAFRDQPEDVSWIDEDELTLIRSGRNVPAEPGATATTNVTGWNSILSNPALWLLCGQQMCRAGAYMFFATWFPTFLQETRGVSVTTSGTFQGLVLAGTLTGSILGGSVADWVLRRTGSLRLSRSGVGGTSLAICATLILGSWFVESAGAASALLALGAFFAAVAGPSAYSVTIDIGGTRVPQVFGLMNMCGNLAAAACPVLVGMIFKRTADWDLVLLLFAGVYFTGAVCWVFLNPNPKSVANE
jgi:ACS family glucarate transporter-like MFS transporter/ACS family D-galactonate transporter-like MFS transporter